MTHLRYLLLVAAIPMLCACESKPASFKSNYVPPLVTESSTPAVTLAGPTVSTTQHSTGAQHGRVIYLSNCTACHEPEPIDEYSMEDWNTRILPKMTVNASLKPDQIADLKAYIAYAHASTKTQPEPAAPMTP